MHTPEDANSGLPQPAGLLPSDQEPVDVESSAEVATFVLQGPDDVHLITRLVLQL